MLLALWADFWPANYGPWPAGNPPPVVNPSPTNAGSGKMREYPQVQQWPDRANDDYWDAREKFLMRHMPITPAPYVAEIPSVRKAVEKHNRAVDLIAVLEIPLIRLPMLEAMLNRLTQQVDAMEQAAEDEAIEILLLL